MHNGRIFVIEKLRRDLLMAAAPQQFGGIPCTSDWEVMCHLAISLGQEDDPLASLAGMAGVVGQVGRKDGVNKSLWLTVEIRGGGPHLVSRCASNPAKSTLHDLLQRRQIDDLHPDTVGRIDTTARAVVPEVVGAFPDLWPHLPTSALLPVRGGDIELSHFTPLTAHA